MTLNGLKCAAKICQFHRGRIIKKIVFPVRLSGFECLARNFLAVYLVATNLREEN
jgi:hypothetical protein